MTPTQQAVHDALAAVLIEFCEMEKSDMFRIYINRNKAGLIVNSKRSDVEASALAEIMENHGLSFHKWRHEQ